MEKAKVWFTDLRAVPGTSLQDKLRRLLNAAGFAQLDLEKKFVAIKINFGEPGNLSYLRANWARTVADMVKAKGGIPFLTDCNTLYVGRRKNAVEHIEAAWENGFGPLAAGCPVIIADGLKGTDEVEVPVVGGVYCKTAKIGRAVMDADVVINLVHFKGHESTGFGGALKNLGMGCGSRAGKMEQHNTGKPSVHEDKCRGCHACTRVCAQSAISFTENNRAHIDHDKCVGCGRCLGMCNFDAIENENWCANTDLVCRIAEYAKAVVDGRPCLNVNFVMDISPYCDCHEENDLPILPDVGIFASADPVAVDQASVDACLAQSPVPGSLLYRRIKAPGFKDKGDHFTNTTPEVEWKAGLAHAEKIGLGTREYEVTVVK